MAPRRPKKPRVEPPSQPSSPNPSGPLPKDPSGVAYILPDGRVIAVDDAEAFFAYLAETEKNPEELKRLLWGLARECDESAKYEGAVAYLEKILTLEEHPGTRARCFLTMGQLFEKKRDFTAAVAAYSRAFTLPARENDTWYLLNNNLGYSLNQMGRQVEAEAFCRAAIAIDPDRHNAHKNLGLSLQGQGRYLEAAHCLLRAAQARPEDFRALDHLEDLLAQHDEIGRDHPEILEAAQECREAARKARAERLM
jgi:tetratricopeptide (TPR) repeat protein